MRCLTLTEYPTNRFGRCTSLCGSYRCLVSVAIATMTEHIDECNNIEVLKAYTGSLSV